MGPFGLRPALLALCSLLFLMFRFGRYIQTGSFDLVQHFLLVDEIMRHGGVRPLPVPNLQTMALYPAASHWLAAIVGWIGGSGLVGITLVSVFSIYVSYLLLISLAGSEAPATKLLFAAAFFALASTHSQVGWEVVTNFFYPQLVAGLIYLLTLFWLSKLTRPVEQAVVVLLSGTAVMWVQPLIAVHILAAGLVLTTFHVVVAWNAVNIPRYRTIVLLLAQAAISIAIIALHPAFRLMRSISANNGYLEFGYQHVIPVIVFCALIAAINLGRALKRRGSRVDAILGSALLAASALAIVQFALLKLHNDGSAYAVKKHMFLVETLGIVNSVRIIGGYLPSLIRYKSGIDLISPLLAAGMSFVILRGFNVAVAPVVNALAYANHVAAFEFPGYAPGNTVTDSSSLPLMANVMVSLTAFQHPFDATAIGWQGGASIKESGKYAMVDRTPYIDTICPERFAEDQQYVIVQPGCLKHYVDDQPLSFATGGNGWQYATQGWGSPEPWGAWTLGDMGGAMVLQLSPADKSPLQLVVDGMAFLSPAHATQKIGVVVNGESISTWTFDEKAPAGERTAVIPARLLESGTLTIVFTGIGAVSPSQIGVSADARVLGLGVKTITLRKLATP